MKKIITLIAAIAMTVTTFAQSPVGSVRFTPQVGVTLANITNAESDMKFGFIAGADAQYQVTDIIAVSGGLFFAQQGTKETESSVDCKLNNNYLNIPILVNAYVAKGLAVKLGLQPSVLLSAKVSAETSGTKVSTDTKDLYNSFDLSMPIGLSYEVNNIVVDARYNLGLTNLLKDVNGDDNGKNSVFQVTVGYRF